MAGVGWSKPHASFCLAPETAAGYRLSKMSSTANTIPNEFEMSGASSIEEWRLFDGIVRKHTDLPDGVHRIGFRCDLDSTGEPAIWIVFVADDDLHPSDEKLAAIKRLGDQIRSEILQSGSERWPFTRIEVE